MCEAGKGVRLGRADRHALMKEAGRRWSAMTPEEKAEWKPAEAPESPGGVPPGVAAIGAPVEIGYSSGTAGPSDREPAPAIAEPAPTKALESSATRFGECVSFHGSQTIARESYGRVITVIHERTARIACAKVYTARPREVKKEIDVLDTLSRSPHPSLLPALAYHLSEALAWIVTPWVQTGSLHAVLKTKGVPLSGVTLIGIAEQVRGAVCHLHTSEFLHLDVKPSNILYESNNGHAYLTDFNLAMRHDPSRHRDTYTGVGPCTWPYRPPEVWKAFVPMGLVTPAVDAFALGISIVETGSLTYMVLGSDEAEAANRAGRAATHAGNAPPRGCGACAGPTR